MQADNIKFRCSQLGKLMTEPRSKSEKLSETTKSYLTEVFVNNKYGRKKDIHNKYIIKGLQCEEDSITLYSRLKGEFFSKNEDRLSNEFIMGTPDLFIGEKIYSSIKVIDIKSSWDIFTFFNTSSDRINRDYYYQLQGYMALTGAKTSTLAYCLVNTPFSLIQGEKRNLMYKMNATTEESPDFVEACAELDRLMIYDDIPLEERVFEIEIPRNEENIQRIYKRVAECREYMNTYLFKSNLVEA